MRRKIRGVGYHSRSRVDRQIDEWVFNSGWIQRPTEARQYCTFAIRMRRPGKMQKGEGETPEVVFLAVLDKALSSEAFQKSEFVPIGAPGLRELRDKCQEVFEANTAKDWRKIILVGIDDASSFGDRNENGTAAVRINFIVCERAGDIYRREDGFRTTDLGAIVDGENVREFPYDEAIEATLLAIRKGILDLRARLIEIVSDRKSILGLKLHGALFLK
jgi:hypothetical protein